MSSEKLSYKDADKKELTSHPFRRMLVGVDVSEQTPLIIRAASYLSNVLQAEVTVCNVANVVTSVQGNDADGFPANEQERDVLEKLEEIIHGEFGRVAESVEVKMLHGDHAERISEYAEYLDCGLVLVGSRSQGALKKALLGSVSSSVASRCKRSVLILR